METHVSLLGPDRLELQESIGRPIRKGSPLDLSGSDATRFRSLVADCDFPNAIELLAHISSLNSFMLVGSLEWCMRWPAYVAARIGLDEAPRATARAHQLWSRLVSSRLQTPERATALLMMQLMNPSSFNHNLLMRFQEQQVNGEPSIVSSLCEAPAFCRTLIETELRNSHFHSAGEAYETYLIQVRSRHDILMRYIWSYASTINALFGQNIAEAALQETLQGCSFNEPMWKLCEKLSPVDLTLVLAEHLRAHFSGPERDGTVAIIEEPDRIRLVLDPCGSGGAMRRETTVHDEYGNEVLPNRTNATWRRAGEVPVYCAHCALNEIVSVQRLGYPAWVTEFNRDPAQPCGWTIYKDPSLIPETYFSRIGAKPPVSTH